MFAGLFIFLFVVFTIVYVVARKALFHFNKDRIMSHGESLAQKKERRLFTLFLIFFIFPVMILISIYSPVISYAIDLGIIAALLHDISESHQFS